MMNFRSAKLLPVFIAASLVVGCEAEISGSSGKAADSGSADFSTFVAIGDSLTAGYADGALYRQIQMNSLPSIMTQQFSLAGGGKMDQPLMPVDATGSLTMMGTDLDRSDRLVLSATGDPDRPASPETIMPTQSTEIMTRLADAGGYNNMGIPSAKSFHLGSVALPSGYGELTLAAINGGTSNPYYARFASSDVATVLSDVLAQVPTFFTLWIGNNDILLYALDGGATQNAVPPYGTATTDVTDPAEFSTAFNGSVAMLMATPGTQGLLINIPDAATIPHFTTVPHNPVPLTQAQANDATVGLANPYNVLVDSRVGLAAGPGTCGITQAEADRRMLSFTESETNALLILDESLTDLTTCFASAVKMRQATARDFILLPTSSKIGVDSGGGLIWGISEPLVDGDVLIEFEYDQLEVARAAYNVTIKAAADANPDLLFLDADALLVELNDTGILYGSGGVSSTFAQGGAFSLDGVHPTARGYAVIANEIFKVINEGFDAYIPPVDPSDYTTVFYQ
jgi:lysophospholipase L1-like esterase